MRRSGFLAAPIALFLGAPALPQEAIADPVKPGEYRDYSSFETFHGLQLNADGTYTWALSAGAMDRQSSGTWAQEDGVVTLTTTPTPVPAEILRDANDPSPDAPFLRVHTPKGRGLAGIDLTLICEDGKRISHYTQEDGWNMGRGECAEPFILELSEPIYNVGPFRFEIESGARGLLFTLVPNDIRVMDLTGSQIVAYGNGISVSLLGDAVTMEPVPAE